MPTWIDFKELRSKLRFEDVLAHYKVEVKRDGEQHMGFCPLPGHGGSKKSQSFSANLERGIFHCFGCGAKGNVLDFAVLMSGARPDDGRAVKQVAAELRAKFFPDDAKQNGRKTAVPEKTEPVGTQLEIAAVVNEPLDFELRGLDPSHPYLKERGFTDETVAYFGLGYCGRGSLTDRIAIPLYDPDGRLIGYAGRLVDDTKITDDNPKYRLPAKRLRSGKTLEFRKALFLYNGHRLTKPVSDLIVVEGFPSVWWLHQQGYPDTVATMGAECSDEQAAEIVALVKPSGRIWIMPDGDKAGERFAQVLLSRLAPERFVRWVKLVKDAQPTDLLAEKLRESLTC